jgi:Transcription activator MBF2
VATTTKKQKWAKPQNVTVTLQYPSSGYGATLTYLYVTVNQTSALGRAYVISGGIGQRFVQLAVESDFTYTMDYSVFFYGV